MKASRNQASPTMPAPMNQQAALSRPMTMAALPVADPTYTPITHRISKAKKGKKVHYCQFQGCEKIFTRAEHRKRHEANHLAEPLYKCEVEECQKPFQRSDLLMRHLERQHGILSPMGTSMARHPRRASSAASSFATSSTMDSPRNGRMASPSQSIASISERPTPTSASLGSIAEPAPKHAFSLPPQNWNQDSYQMAMTMTPGTFPPDLVYGYTNTDELPPYSSDSCYSPISDVVPQAHIGAQPYLPYYEKPRATSANYSSGYNTPAISAPMVGWMDYEEFSQPIDGLGIGFESQTVDTITPTIDVIMGRDAGQSLRAESAPAAGSHVVADKSGLVKAEAGASFHQYYELYWQNFHPDFPVVHYPTLEYAKTESPLNAMVLAIGAQFSHRPDAKAQSLAWFGLASKQCATMDMSSITSRAPVTILQTIFLMEIYTLYHSRAPGVYRSQQFSNLYACLLNDREQLNQTSSSIVQNFSPNPSDQDLHAAHSQWLDLESRHRLLLSSFLLDTHRSLLFQQAPATSSFPKLPPVTPQAAWDSTSLPTWHSILSNPTPQTSTSSSTTITTSDRFGASLLLSHTLRSHALVPDPQHPASLSLHPTPLAHALTLASQTPIHALLLTASNSWLYGRKSSRSTLANAQSVLQTWLNGPDALVALWHAGAILRASFPLKTGYAVSGFGLHTPWTLYLAALVCWAFGTPCRVSFSASSSASASALASSSSAAPLAVAIAPSATLPPSTTTTTSTTTPLPLPLQTYLAHLNAPSPLALAHLRGRGGVERVVEAVRAVLKPEGGLLLVEALGVLGGILGEV